MKKKHGECAIRQCRTEMIERKILISLSDESKVVLILDLEMLTDLIEALDAAGETARQKGLNHDLRQLRRAAFNVPL